MRRDEIKVTQEEIDSVPSGDPGQWETSMRELCQEIEKLPASEQQTSISVKASAIYQSLAEFNRYCESQFDAKFFEKLWNEKSLMSEQVMCRCGHENSDHKQMFDDGHPTSHFPCQGYGCVCGAFEAIDWEESDANHEAFMDYQRSIKL